jgi:predicted RNA-binding Zn ribbon-like protein
MTAYNQTSENNSFIVAPRSAMCIDFANTVAWRGSSPAESLRSFSDLTKWCTDTGLIPARLSHQLRKWPDKHPKRAAEIFDEAIALRETIYRVFHSVAAGTHPDEADLELLSRALADAPLRTTIQRTADGFGWQLSESKTTVSSLLAPVLWSSGDLLVGPQLARLRECSNDKCLWLFIDDSKNGTRRWCSMQACGNRAKAHRHYLRQKLSG